MDAGSTIARDRLNDLVQSIELIPTQEEIHQPIHYNRDVKNTLCVINSLISVKINSTHVFFVFPELDFWKTLFSPRSENR